MPVLEELQYNGMYIFRQRSKTQYLNIAIEAFISTTKTQSNTFFKWLSWKHVGFFLFLIFVQNIYNFQIFMGMYKTSFNIM